eukprot:TRINITY_DN91563_c0_g1_i1.p1 TRINITY_DN91563_c0_g1~~TRINITY_DN91563_c0_g1_i1.p1  ORF type:complete len:682 (-),score=127.36 TRINITY_DN91563_c0_g1_i1:27-2072(-)
MWLVPLLLWQLVSGHPSNLECNDPRFDAGNKVMHVYTQPNNKDPALSFTADAYEYSHGSEVKITIEAKGSKYVESPYGVFLALRAQPVLGWKGDYGMFSNFTGGLNLTTKTWGAGPCLNTAISQTGSPFKGMATLTWTAGEIYGDVIISLLWGNGLGPDDPLAHKFPNLTHAYLYSRTITLKGPPMPSYPPHLHAASPTSYKCVAPTGSRYNLPHSPVFVQTLRTFPAKSITFPAGRCMACREDQQHLCLSAQVDCPVEPGLLAVEHLFRTRDCSGPATVSRLPTSFAHCPGHGYHSPENVDLERFVKKLQRDHASYFPDDATARSAISEYRRILYLMQKFPDSRVVPSKLVDLVWHEHILDTQTYKKDSQRLFGRYIHHAPAFGDDEDEKVKDEKKEMLKDQASMFKEYVQLFEDEPPRDVWPTATQQPGARLPDCCKALCVKPNCASCVGCNAVDCGKAEEAADLLRKVKDRGALEVLPDHFAGYVPLPKSLAQRAESQTETYLCEATALPGMNLAWTISGDHIYMKQTLTKVDSWYGVGFSDTEPHDMSYSDFIVTMFNRNYTGVRDMYKFDAGNGYPCWDVLHQCSLNGTAAGSMDLADRTNTRENGVSVSSWTRKLVTGDWKDSPITASSKKVLFAFGIDDDFTYHGKAQAAACDVNFFTGDVSCSKSEQTSPAFV